MTKCSVYSGEILDLDNLDPEKIKLSDIAHHLSLICRFGGSCRKFYSVAQHSLYCYSLFNEFCAESYRYEGDVATTGIPIFDDEKTQEEIGLYLLLHDAHEYITNDIIQPVKNKFSDISKFQDGIDKCIWEKFGLEEPSDKIKGIIKEFDLRALKNEAALLLDDNGFNLIAEELKVIKEVYPFKEVYPSENSFMDELGDICGYSFERAETEYLNWIRIIMRRREMRK